MWLPVLAGLAGVPHALAEADREVAELEREWRRCRVNRWHDFCEQELSL